MKECEKQPIQFVYAVCSFQTKLDCQRLVITWYWATEVWNRFHLFIVILRQFSLPPWWWWCKWWWWWQRGIWSSYGWWRCL